MITNGFVELNEELYVTGGSVTVGGLILSGAAGYVVGKLADEGIKRATGKSFSQNMAYYSGKAISAVGDGLSSVGDYLND